MCALSGEVKFYALCYFGYIAVKWKRKQLVPTTVKSFLLAHCILVDSSTVICWMSLFVILGCWVYFVAFILYLMENPVSKQYRHWSAATLYGI